MDATDRTERLAGLLLIGVMAAYAVYAVAFIWRMSFVIEGERHFLLAEDAMILMRYAKNLADGHGLVWHPGAERVEGITNLLWTGYMALFHLLPLPASKTSLPIMVTGALCVLLTAACVWRLGRRFCPDSAFVGPAAAALCAFYLPFGAHALRGSESGVLTLLTAAAAVLTLEAWEARRFSPWPYIMLAAGVGIRLDAAVGFLVFVAAGTVFDAPRRRRHLAVGLGLLAAVVAAQTGFRLVYYGEWLPNTYYLKMTGYPLVFRMSRGLYEFAMFGWRMSPLLFVFPWLALAMRRDRETALLAGLFAGHAAYSVYVGGDFWTWWGGSDRFLLPGMPGFFLLCCVAFHDVAPALHTGLRDRRLAAGAAGLCFVLAAVQFNAIAGPRSLLEWSLQRRPQEWWDSDIMMTRRAYLLDDITTPDAVCAVAAAGTTPYFLARPTVDFLGKCDKAIARLPARQVQGWARLRHFWPGHLKWDYAYTIETYNPDVIVEFWEEVHEAVPALEGRYEPVDCVSEWRFWLRTGSPRIRWDRVEALCVRVPYE